VLPASIDITLPITDRAGRKLEIRSHVGEEERVAEVSITLATGIYNPITRASRLDDAPFIEMDGRHARIGAGSWTVSSPIVLARGVTFEIAAGVTLRFAPDAYLLVRGALLISGTREDPVLLTSLVAGQPWKGVYVLEADSPSVLQDVRFENTTFFNDSALQLTGAINFYRSEVSMQNVTFKDSVAEDALNIIRSDFSMQDVIFDGSRSDAFDSDFAVGQMSDVTFRNIKGDGLDTSGSEISATRLIFEQVLDKAISAGEASTLDIGFASMTHSGVGIAAKDSSVVTIDELKIDSAAMFSGMAYNKKPLFGKGVLRVMKSNASADSFRAQMGSEIYLAGKQLPVFELDVEALYESGSMKKIQ
jgi:hypothetical protein